MTTESQNPRCRVKLSSCAATAWSSCAVYTSDIRYYKILSSCYTFFLARQGYHGMIGLPSTAATATNDNVVYGMISSWSQTQDHQMTGMIRYGITRFHFCKNLKVLRGVICRVKGVNCREKGLICLNCETTHFQFRHSRFFRYDTGDKPWAHITHIVKLRDPFLFFFDTGTMPPTSPVFGFMGFLVLSSFALFHSILATCSSHTGMSCKLFSRWFGATSRHNQYPTVVALESQLGITYLDMTQTWFSKDTFLAQGGWNCVLFAKRPKHSTGGCCSYVYIYTHVCIYIYTYLYLYIYIYISVYIYIHNLYIHIYICIFIYTYLYIYIYLFIHICINIYIYISVYMHIFILYIYTYLYVCIYSYHMYIYMYVQMYYINICDPCVIETLGLV